MNTSDTSTSSLLIHIKFIQSHLIYAAFKMQKMYLIPKSLEYILPIIMWFFKKEHCTHMQIFIFAAFYFAHILFTYTQGLKV